MEEFFIDIFGSYGRIIAFVHIISASLLIGALFSLRFIVKTVFDGIAEEQVRCNNFIKLLDRYSFFILPVMILLISASFMMSVGLGFEYASPQLHSLIHIKEALWLFMCFNFAFMYYKIVNAKRSYKKRDFFEIQENIILITNYLVPLNLILALIAAFIGVIIRGF